MIISHNNAAQFASRIEGINTQNLQKSMEKLSSGERINRAGDDASNLAVSEKMRSQIRGLSQASKNISNGVSFLQTAEGYMSETTDILQRIRELAVQSANGIYSDEDRSQITVEISQLVAEVDRIASSAQFNGMNILSGRFAEEGINFQIGSNMDQNVNIKIGSMSAEALGIRGTQSDESIVSVADQESANMTIGTIDEALKRVNQSRANLGAAQNRFEIAKKGIDIANENLTASESKIRDTDVAEEIVNYTKNNILTQSVTAMLAQANSNSQNVLSLLR